MDESEWYSVDDNEGKPRIILKAEIYATHYENLIRAEHGFELRTHYSMNKSGRPDGGRVIKKRNQAIFFDSFGNHRPNYESISKNNYIY